MSQQTRVSLTFSWGETALNRKFTSEPFVWTIWDSSGHTEAFRNTSWRIVIVRAYNCFHFWTLWLWGIKNPTTNAKGFFKYHCILVSIALLNLMVLRWFCTPKQLYVQWMEFQSPSQPDCHKVKLTTSIINSFIGKFCQFTSFVWMVTLKDLTHSKVEPPYQLP